MFTCFQTTALRGRNKYRKTLNPNTPMHYFKNITYALIASLLLFSACGEDEDPEPVGNPPIANAGADLQAKVNSSVTLNGTGSSDPDGAITYSWALTTLPSGSSASVNGATQATATFTPDVVGTYVATLTVTDTDNNTATDAVTIIVTEAVGTPPVAVIVDKNSNPISEDRKNNTVTVTSPYALDGSRSSDQDGDALTYAWTIADKPSGSAATISGNDQAQAVFTPDVVGEYVIRLTMSDPGGNTNAAEVTLVANASPVIVSGTISADTVWKDIFADPNVPDYLATGNVTAAAELTVAPGVVVHFSEDVVFTINENGGALIAEGTAEKGIVFTSADEAGDVHWGGLVVKSSSSKNILNYTRVSYAGGEDNLLYASSAWRKGGIAVSNDGRLKLTNSTLANNLGDGIFVEGANSLTEFTGNAFANNADYAMSVSINQAGVIDAASTFADNGDTEKRENVVRIYDSSLDEDQQWVALNSDASYVMVGNVTLNAELTVDAGARLEFEEDIWMSVASGGALIASGTQDNKIIFTSTNPDEAQYWGGIVVKSSSTKNSLDHVVISYGGGFDNLLYAESAWRKASLAIADDAKISVTNSEFNFGEGHGIFSGPTGEISGFASNSFRNIVGYPVYVPINLAGMVDANTVIESNADDVVAVYQSTLNGDALFNDASDPKWNALSGTAKYLFVGKVTLNDDLVIAAGAYLAFGEEVVMEVASSGSLKAVGTTTDQIIFTAYDRSGNDNWGGLVIKSDNANEIQNAEVSYAGKEDQLIYTASGWRAANIALSEDASLDINNTLVSNSDDYGLVVGPGGEVNGLTRTDANAATTVGDANNFTGNENADAIVFF